MSHHHIKGPAGHYSATNPVPNIHQFVENLDKEKRERDAQIEARRRVQGDEIRDHSPLRDSGVSGTKKRVTDPVTGREVEIEDVNEDFMNRVENPTLPVPNANLGKPTPVKTDARQSGEEYRHNQDVTAPPDPVVPNSTSDVPLHGEKTNILFHPTPSVSYEVMFESMEKQTTILVGAVFLAIVVFGKMFGASLYGLIPLGLCVSSGIFLTMKELVRQGRDTEWSGELKRGEYATANLIPESVEWMNTFLGIVWGRIDPDMFASIADLIEDVMQASLPGIVENVRIAEINQGTNPFRILSLRALPDSHVQEMKDDIRSRNEQVKDPQELAADEEGGDYYNMECSFAYHSSPQSKASTSISEKAKNMHMQLIFYLGIKGLFGVPLPIFVELQGLVGTVRLRLRMSPEPPFLKALTFTLMGVPKVQAACVPMLETGINVLNLPLISNFVNYAIAATSNEYVAPKSMTLDMAKILEGDDIQKDTEAIGVLWIRIHKAVELSKQDRRGSTGGGSDPYITVSFSKYHKPMYSTRVIQDNLNPVWEETCALLVTPDLIKADEQLSMELWDSDRATADDVVGKIELSMQKLIQHPSKMYPQVSKLRGIHADSTMPGELHWEVGYFEKPQFRPGLRTHGKNINLPAKLRDKKEFQDERGSIDNAYESAVVRTPPDPLWPSGICSVVVHQIVNLEHLNVKGSRGKRKGREFEPAQESGESTEEEAKKLPSAYCILHFNDQLIYRTRTKAVSSKPIFNAGTERFVGDWRSAIVTVTIRDQRMREHDPILGVVPLKLSDILQTSSQVTRWYPLDGGIGFGRIRISLLFRSVETRLPPQQLGWDVGTFEFTSARILATGYMHHAKLKMRTGGSSGKIARTHCTKTDEGDGMYWDLNRNDGEDNIRLPVKYRYRAPIIFELHSARHRSADAYAVIWLHHFVDNEVQNINIPLWKTDNGMRLTQNYITEENYKTIPNLAIEEVGRLQFQGRFKAGMDGDHALFVTDNDSRETQETWEACHAEGVRGDVVTKELSPEVRQLHEESLMRPRDVLRHASEGEKEKWLASDGTDWRGAFGNDLRGLMDQRRGEKLSGGGSKSRRENKKLGHITEEEEDNTSSSEDNDSENDSDSDSDLGLHDALTHDTFSSDTQNSTSSTSTSTHSPSSTHEHKQHLPPKSRNPLRQTQNYRDKKKDLHRKQRGLMQWKPLRSARFAKNQVGFAVRRVRAVGSLKTGKGEVGVESEAR